MSLSFLGCKNMKVSSFALIIPLFIFSACEIAVPNSSTSGDSQETSFRAVKVKCSNELSACVAGEDQGAYEVYARYSAIKCSAIQAGGSEDFIINATAPLICKEGECRSQVTEFNNLNGDLFLTDDGLYTLYVFIDLNQNESVDNDEPYFCTDEVSINSFKKKVDLKLELSRNFGDSEDENRAKKKGPINRPRMFFN